MTVSRLRDIPGIGVDVVGDAADAAGDPEILRLENLDTDVRPPEVALEITPAQASALLFEHGQVAATPMDGWGPSGAHYLRLVFANEPIERLASLAGRFRRALG
ncbi:MAG TPA: hypothetical protein VHY31_25085 [Streptosporangiaceae bacterium]|nr:hypothetical protein [Streptosporangiaceae bacterium]